jgi:predicted aspartyl protease
MTPALVLLSGSALTIGTAVTLLVSEVPVQPPADRSVRRQEVLPVRLHRGFLVRIDVRVGALWDLDFILDTGATRSVVDARIARTLGLSGFPTTVRGLQERRAAEDVLLPTLQVGPLEVVVRALATDLSALTATHGFAPDGILGLDVLRGVRFAVDYEKRVVQFGTTGDGPESIPLDRASPYLVVNTRIDGTRLKLAVDTGSDAVALFAGAIPGTLRDAAAGDLAAVGLEGAIRLKHLRPEWFSLGDARWRRPSLYVMPGESADKTYQGLLGPRALGIRHIVVDLELMRFSWRR